jgi:hypothetical protein
LDHVLDNTRRKQQQRAAAEMRCFQRVARNRPKLRSAVETWKRRYFFLLPNSIALSNFPNQTSHGCILQHNNGPTFSGGTQKKHGPRQEQRAGSHVGAATEPCLFHIHTTKVHPFYTPILSIQKQIRPTAK